ncbi:hypothetical protein C6501_17020 [Candidatus Poribacteria bacterium]|nr:MAG: hypothetical protein C6501_17020 [Candidatus Poribacteria bacterium]
MKHIVDNVNKLELTFKTIDLEGRIPSTDSIEFLSVEEPYREGRRYSPFVRVRYALNGVKQDKAFPLDVDKGIFLSIDDDVLEKRLRPIAPKIVKILQEQAVQQNVERGGSIRMTLKEHIDDIRNQLKQGAFTNEAEVSQDIIIRVLEVLEWPRFTPKVIIPQYGVEGRRVDFALCHPQGKPRVFIEVKQVGNLDGAEKQLFGYAFDEGVPIAVLTDGQKWQFFHPTGEGKFRERKVYELDLIETDSEESVARLNRYLNYEAFQNGQTVTAIKSDYQEVLKQREIEARLPEAWNKLLQDEDEFSESLLKAMIGKTESLCGTEPTQEQVLTFLKRLERKTEPKPVSSTPDPKYKMPSALPNETSNFSQSPKSQTRLRVTMPNREVIDHYNALDTFIEVIEKLGPEEVMRVHPTVVSTKQFDHQHKSVRKGQYFISTNHGTPQKKGHLVKIAKGLGVQLNVEVVDK